MIFCALKRILPQAVFNAIQKINFDLLYEIRLRSNRSVTVYYGGRYYYLCSSGISTDTSLALKVTIDDIYNTVINSANHSLYAVNDTLTSCYITCGGIRIGVAGEIVHDENGKVITLKNFCSINVRIPHEVKGCANKVVQSILDKQIKNTLIISPPGAGKTTLVRDVARILASTADIYNVLIADERGEIASTINGINSLDVGINCDVISGCNKNFAFSRAIRGLKPDVIIADELADVADCSAVMYAISSGVSVIATIHANGISGLKTKPFASELVGGGYINRYVELCANPVGHISGIYDETFKAVI